jgi:DNA-binding transcriptional regulator LsrR (DeoR family)
MSEGGQVMNDADLQILTMYYKDGMKETEVAKSLGISLFVVHEVLAAFDWTEEDEA